MRLAVKIFAASTLTLVALVGVAGGSLLAVDRLVDAHREIIGTSIPAVRLEASLREAVPRLLWLEARHLVLRDHTYAHLLTTRVDQAMAEIEQLGGFVRSPAERAAHRRAGEALAAYREQLTSELALVARGETSRARRLSEGPARLAAADLEEALARLTHATSSEVDRAQAAVRALETRTWRAVLVVLTGSVAGAIATIGWVSLRTTRSVRRLSEATARVASGSFDAPLPVETRDEIGELTRSFNRMAEQLREVETLKQRFFSNVTHELRNPLTAISSASQLLQNQMRGVLDAKQGRWLQIVDASVTRLLGLINQILDWNRLRAGVFPLERQSLALDKVVAHAVDLLRAQAEQRGLGLEERAVGTDFTVVADEEALTKVVVNLVGNAIKFTGGDGTVAVAVTDAGAHVELTVRDTGPGIAAEDLGRIFEPYQQAHRGRKGSGLGLAIVKELVEAHGGRVGVESRLGEGTTFTIRLARTAHVA